MRIVIEIYEVCVEYLAFKYQEVSFHIIFDFNMGDNFCRKHQLLAGGNKTTTTYSLINSSVVFPR